ncbi:Myotubularin-related protein 9 [Chionoecetes opilio]|uniref:Myotubularin-related protein 9 n=1 Tax=Chionoecetes opilio TaxID=41210 RepID=A0A8J4YFP4_CHIOP|nr:Myotubularin-related protein 9 [Chionoecetes opilio]
MEFAELIRISRCDRVMLHRPHHQVLDGTLCITGHHLIVSGNGEEPEELWLLHSNIDAIERRQQGMTGGTLWLKCKDLRILQLDVIGADQFAKVADTLEDLIRVEVDHKKAEDPTFRYPFFYRAMYTILEDGWTTFLPESEFSRLIQPGDDWRISYVNKDYKVCASYPSAVVVPKNMEDSDLVAIANFRQGGRFPVLAYRHEGSAPHALPAVLLRSGQPLITANGRRCKEDERLLNSVLAREKRGYIIDTRTQNLAQSAKEIHTVTFTRPRSDGTVTLCCLCGTVLPVWRAQCAGNKEQNRTRSLPESPPRPCSLFEAVFYLQWYSWDSQGKGTQGDHGALMERRQWLGGSTAAAVIMGNVAVQPRPGSGTARHRAAIANHPALRGGNYEPELHYPNWRRVHKPIDRHHVLLDSLTKLMDGVNDTNSGTDKWLSRLESSSWMNNIKETLNCACLVAQCLDQDGASVLVHDTDGLDSTLQVTSLAQIILNPDCRTVRGFEALIEREWIQGGHPFATRHARSCYTPSAQRSKINAPTFLLFLDCVYQIHSQFSCSFEFAENFLVMLFEHSYSSQFGTFLGNNEGDKRAMKAPSRTASLWSYVNRHEVLPKYLNPMYEPNQRVIWPSVAPMSLQLWAGVFLRWVVNQGPQEAAWLVVKELRERDAALRSKVSRLRRQLHDLEREALEVGVLSPATGLEVA